MEKHESSKTEEQAQHTTQAAETPEPPVLPAAMPSEPPTVPEPMRMHHTKRWTIIGVILLCFVASFLGAWLFVATGLVRLDSTRTITDNRQTLVLQQGEIVSQVFKDVSPSTVAITTESATGSGRGSFGQTTEEGAGSGIIVSADGYILTNKHVVPDGTGKVTVITADGTQYTDVKIVGRDPLNDIAFLKVNGVSNFKAATIGDSGSVSPGQQVVAIGNALGIYRNSVTSGIISGVGRPVTASDETGASSEQLEDLFQTDAAINPGNSGGPLVNLKGEVIGINTAVSQDGQAIGFAIPINDAKGLISSVTKTGQLVRPYLGVRYLTLTPDVAKQANVSQTQGALVVGGDGQPAIVSGSPADKAGIKEGDVITKVNGQTITEDSGLSTKLSQFSAGDTIQLTLIRGGKEQTVQVTLQPYPSS